MVNPSPSPLGPSPSPSPSFLSAFLTPAPSGDPTFATAPGAPSLPGSSAGLPAVGGARAPIEAEQQAVPPTTSATPTPGLDLPGIPDLQEVDAQWWKQYGRGPTSLELSMIRAAPVIRGQLGRPPTRAELLQFMQSRNETRSVSPQFEVDQPAPGSEMPI